MSQFSFDPDSRTLTEVLMTSRLYWIGQYDGVKKLDWFFKFDLARPIVDGAKRAFREGKHVLMTSRLYWIDQYEGAKKLEWFKFDLAHPIVICAKRVFGEGKHVASFQLYNCGACIDGEGTNIQ